MNRFKHVCIGSTCLAVILVAGPASAALIELEPNDTISDATLVTRGAVPWLDLGVPELEAGGGDVDFFEVSLNAGELVLAGTLPLKDPFVAPDTVLGLFDQSGSLLTVNDDADASTKGSEVSWVAGYTGPHYIAVSGFDDLDFDGYSDAFPAPHGHDGLYVLSVTIVPEPASFVLLGAGVFLVVARRRR